MSQGLEALVGSLFLCDRAPHAAKPPKPALKLSVKLDVVHTFQDCRTDDIHDENERYSTYGDNCCFRTTTKHHVLQM